MTGSTGGSFYNVFMRFWILVFLMVLIPLQVSTAAVGQYCQHETVAPVAHWGHHTHQHKTSAKADSHADIGKAVAADLVARGVSRSAITVQAYGESRPLVATADGVREPQNRRVEIILR